MTEIDIILKKEKIIPLENVKVGTVLQIRNKLYMIVDTECSEHYCYDLIDLETGEGRTNNELYNDLDQSLCDSLHGLIEEISIKLNQEGKVRIIKKLEIASIFED